MSRTGTTSDARGIDLEPELRSRLRELITKPGRVAAQYTHETR